MYELCMNFACQNFQPRHKIPADFNTTSSEEGTGLSLLLWRSGNSGRGLSFLPFSGLRRRRQAFTHRRQKAAPDPSTFDPSAA